MGICYATIGQSTVGIVEDCGKFERLARPGCTCLNPCTGSVVGK